MARAAMGRAKEEGTSRGKLLDLRHANKAVHQD